MTTMVTNTPKLNPPTVGAKPPPPLPKLKATLDGSVSGPPPSPAPPKRGLVLPIEKVHESSSNTRKRFPPEAELRELGESIRDHGLLQPVLVRTHPTKKDDFELVFGACRLRGSKLVGLKSIEATCRELTDSEVLEIQVIENNQRNDVHPLEEAEGYSRLLNDHGYNADKLAEKLNRSREYVYSRIKLLSLSPKSREAMYDGHLSASNALYVARLPTAKLQEEAIHAIDGMSAREAAQVVRNRFMLKMLEATFDTKDATLLPAAGPCTTCPKRTKNAKEIFGDVKGQDLCTDPGCFKSKREADGDRKIEEAKKAGVEVLAKPVERYDYSSNPVVVLDVECRDDAKGRTYRELLKGVKDAPTIALARDRGGDVIEVMKRDDVTAALAKKHAFAREVIKEEKKQDRDSREFEKASALTKIHRELVDAEIVERVERRQPKAAFFACVAIAIADFADVEIVDVLEHRGLLPEGELDDAIDTTAILSKIKDDATLRGIIAEIVCRTGDHSSLASGRTALISAYDVDTKALEKKAREELKKAAKA